MTSRIRRAAIGILALLALSACASSSPTPAGRYLGAVTPANPGPLCTPSKAVAQIRDGIVIFAPDEGTWILEGVANADGTLTADHARQTPSRQLYATTLEARWTTDEVSGTYKTPRCTYTVTLTRQ